MSGLGGSWWLLVALVGFWWLLVGRLGWLGHWVWLGGVGLVSWLGGLLGWVVWLGVGCG